MIKPQKEKILTFIKSQGLGVIATVSKDGLPESAVIGISETDDLNLIFGTFKQYRKYQNLKANPHVAFAIGFDNITVQYEGIAEELFGDEKKLAKRIHTKKLPSFQKFAELPEQCYFKVKPIWIRYTNYAQDNLYGDVFELNFDLK